MRQRLKNHLEGAAFAAVVQSLIALSLLSFCVETLPGLSPKLRHTLYIVEVVTVGLFTVEYLLRLFCENRPLDYAFSFFGIVDLLAIVPFYLSTGLDFRAIRSFRFLRVFQLLKLSRYSRAMRRFHLALLVAKEELVLFCVLSLILQFLSSVGIYYFEREAQPDTFCSIFHSLWWSVATLTTVGYGDIYPITAGGKLFTFFVLVIGLGVVAMPAGLIASALSEARNLERKEQDGE